MRALAAASAAIGIAPDADGIDALVYGFTNRVLAVIVVQLGLVTFAILPVAAAFSRFFVPFNFIINGFGLEIGPATAVAISLVFGFVGSVWQFATVLSIRSYPLEAHAQSPKGHHSFIPVAIVGGLLTTSLITVGGVLIGTNSLWMEPIEKNFGILLKAASINEDAAAELNRLQMRVQCCGTSMDSLLGHETDSDSNDDDESGRVWSLPTRLAAFEPYATWFDAMHYGSGIRAAKNLPFSCCRKDTVTPCRHFNLDPIVHPRDSPKASNLPELGSSDPTVALESLNTATPCPERIFELIKWEFFIYCGGSLLAAGIVASVGTGALVLAQIRVSKATKAFLESGKVPASFGLKTVEMEPENDGDGTTPGAATPATPDAVTTTPPTPLLKKSNVSSGDMTN
uniref:Tetraspanin n=1 Tax=Panagrellus redivivus TaxID=6233 RepID=A0A7E4VJG7_PANRE